MPRQEIIGWQDVGILIGQIEREHVVGVAISSEKANPNGKDGTMKWVVKLGRIAYGPDSQKSFTAMGAYPARGSYSVPGLLVRLLYEALHKLETQREIERSSRQQTLDLD